MEDDHRRLRESGGLDLLEQLSDEVIHESDGSPLERRMCQSTAFPAMNLLSYKGIFPVQESRVRERITLT